MGHGVDLVRPRRTAAIQTQRLLPVASPDTPGEFGHDLQVAGDQAVEQPRQRHRQAAEKHPHPQQAGQAGGVQAPVHRAQVDAHFQLAQVPHRPGRRLVIQGESLDAQRPLGLGLAAQHREIVTEQAHPGDVRKVHQPAQLHIQLRLVEVPQAALQAGQVAGADQRHARLDVAHLAAVLEIQLHRTGEHGEAQAEQQDEQQQAPQQAVGVQANHRASAGRLIMSR
ncbi:hypothetical protein D3C76_1052590 [compost metagenome]